jgi:hypothetical protein
MVAPVLIRLPDVSALDGYTQFGMASTLAHLQKSINLYAYPDNLLHLGNFYEVQGNLQKHNHTTTKRLLLPIPTTLLPKRIPQLT